MSYPKSIEELAQFLVKYPALMVEAPDGKLSSYRFANFNGKIFLFRCGTTQISFPVKIGEFHFYSDRFERRVFHRKEKFHYMEKKVLPSIEAEWDELLVACKFK